MLRGLRGIEFRLGRRAPLVGLRAEILDLVDRFRSAQEGGHVGGKRSNRQTVNHAMPLVFPSATDRRRKRKTKQPDHG